jgi:hypothetical protein
MQKNRTGHNGTEMHKKRGEKHMNRGQEVVYYNRFHVRFASSAAIPCRTPGCKHILATNIDRYAALLEYWLHDNPAATMKFDCPACGRTSVYDYSSLMKLMPSGSHRVALPSEMKWTVVLLEVPTAPAMQERLFFGERVLVHEVLEEPRGWVGILLSESQLAPSLHMGSMLVGQILNGYYVCSGVSVDGANHALPLIDSLPRGELDIATFLVPKTGHTDLLQNANLECANPSCAHYFGLTYTEFRQAVLSQNPRVEGVDNGRVDMYVAQECLICQTSRIVDARSFDGLYKL